MKNQIQLLYGIIICMILISCNADDVESNSYNKYYQFSNDDYNSIISYDYKIGQIITYQNQFGEELNFKVILNETKKSGDYSSGFFNASVLNHYYDSKRILFEILENDNYGYNKGLIIYAFSKNYNKFSNGINLPMWNISSSTFIDEVQYPINISLRDYNNFTKINKTINGRIFEDVVVIESGSDNEESLNLNYGTLPKRVNKLYYDYEFGIIRFDDIDGNQWELIYPE